MKKQLFAIITFAVALCACGGATSGGSSSSSDSGSSNSSSLVDGKWPTAIYDKYGIDELKTNGKIVFTQFFNEGSYQYEVYFKDVTREELLAWVESLKAKGFRISDRDQEAIEKSSWDHDIMIYQPEEKKDMRMRLSYDFKNGMSFEYYGDEPNPAYEITEEKDEEGDIYQYINYNFSVSLNPMDNVAKAEGKIDALGLTAGDITGSPAVRVINMTGNDRGGNIGVTFYSDHIFTEEDAADIHGRVADALEAHGAHFYQALSEKPCTAAELKEKGIRMYGVEKDGQKFLLMPNSDATVGHFGSGINFMFNKTTR